MIDDEKEIKKERKKERGREGNRDYISETRGKEKDMIPQEVVVRTDPSAGMRAGG